MKISKEKQMRIQNAIKNLKLSKVELDSITTGNMARICNLAQCRMIELMWYLRYGR